MEANGLVIGQAYFMVTYPGVSLTTPVVISYKYLGPMEIESPSNGTEIWHAFEYLPAFRYDDEPPEDETTLYSEQQLAKLSDISGLIEELSCVRQRLQALVAKRDE